MFKSWAKKLAMSALAAAAVCLLSLPARAQSGGEKTYKAKCAMCHSADGSGSSPTGKALKVRPFCSDEVKKETDAQLTEIIVKGKNKMPSYDKKLTETEIKDVVAYIRGLCK